MPHFRLATLPSQLITYIRHYYSELVLASRPGLQQVQLDGREGWHFSRAEDGTYATHHLADGTAAIAHLEALRSEGGDYLLFPRSALWWLERYEKLSQHLESRYQAVVRQEDACVVFALRELTVRDQYKVCEE